MAIAFNKPLVCPVLIGRTTELEALRLLIDQAKSGQGQVALVSGEGGQELTQHDEQYLLQPIKELIAAGDRLLPASCCPLSGTRRPPGVDFQPGNARGGVRRI